MDPEQEQTESSGKRMIGVVVFIALAIASFVIIERNTDDPVETELVGREDPWSAGADPTPSPALPDAAAPYDPTAFERARTGEEYQSAWRSLGVADGIEFDRRVELVLADPDRYDEQASMIRVLWEFGPRRAGASILRAIRELPDVERDGRPSIPSVAVAFLEERAEKSQVAKEVLAVAAEALAERRAGR